MRVIDWELYKHVPCICQVRTVNICFKGNVVGMMSEEANDAVKHLG